MPIILILLLASLCTMCNAVSVAPDDPLLQLDGRFKRDATSGVASFDAPGFKITFKVSGTLNVDINLSAGGVDKPHIFWVYINDILVEGKVIDTSSLACCNTMQTFNVVGGLDATKTHEITLLKVTESDYNNGNPTVNYLNFHGFELDAGSVEKLPSLPPHRKIEFIGDSITCGYCNQCPSDNKAIYSVESFALSWPTLTARALNASIHTSAWSGLGMVRNYGDGSTFMPEIYQRTLMTVPSSDWSFETTDWVPDAVVINLGSNDNLNPTTPTDAERSYEVTYVNLVKNISTWYSRDYRTKSPSKKTPAFFLACGPLTSSYCPYVFNVIETLSKVMPAISVTFLDQRDAMKNTALCCGHPSAAGDMVLADVTIAGLSSVLNW